MAKFAILLGSAPEDFRQKKLEEMFDFLDSKRSAGDSIVTFANGISEMMLEIVMNNSVKQKPDSILLYICTLQPVGDGEKSFWLGGEEIRRDVILHYQELAAECGIDMQVIFDSDGEMVREEELGWEEVGSVSHSELDSESVNKQPLKQSADDNECPQVQGDGLFGGAR